MNLFTKAFPSSIDNSYITTSTEKQKMTAKKLIFAAMTAVYAVFAPPPHAHADYTSKAVDGSEITAFEEDVYYNPDNNTIAFRQAAGKASAITVFHCDTKKYVMTENEGETWSKPRWAIPDSVARDQGGYMCNKYRQQRSKSIYTPM